MVTMYYCARDSMDRTAKYVLLKANVQPVAKWSRRMRSGSSCVNARETIWQLSVGWSRLAWVGALDKGERLHPKHNGKWVLNTRWAAESKVKRVQQLGRSRLYRVQADVDGGSDARSSRGFKRGIRSRLNAADLEQWPQTGRN